MIKSFDIKREKETANRKIRFKSKSNLAKILYSIEPMKVLGYSYLTQCFNLPLKF